MECPNCRLFNPATAQRCDCGFDFASRMMRTSFLSPAELKRATADPNPAVYVPYFGIFFRLFKLLYDSISGEGRRRRKLKAAYVRAKRFGPPEI
jgi:hypothetical protein